jgi:hypothetical protein
MAEKSTKLFLVFPYLELPGTGVAVIICLVLGLPAVPKTAFDNYRTMVSLFILFPFTVSCRLARRSGLACISGPIWFFRVEQTRLDV